MPIVDDGPTPATMMPPDGMTPDGSMMPPDRHDAGLSGRRRFNDHSRAALVHGAAFRAGQRCPGRWDGPLRAVVLAASTTTIMRRSLRRPLSALGRRFAIFLFLPILVPSWRSPTSPIRSTIRLVPTVRRRPTSAATPGSREPAGIRTVRAPIAAMVRGPFASAWRGFGSTTTAQYMWENFHLFAGPQGFKSSTDLFQDGNFGTHEGLNWGMPVWDDIGLGYQKGFQMHAKQLERRHRHGRRQSLPQPGLRHRRSVSSPDQGHGRARRFGDRLFERQLLCQNAI